MVEAVAGTGGVRRNALERCRLYVCARAAGGGQLWCDRIAEAGRLGHGRCMLLLLQNSTTRILHI